MCLRSQRRDDKPNPTGDSAKPNHPLVYVMTSPEKHVADIWAGILADEGICSVVKTCPPDTGPVSGLIRSGMTQFEIHVSESDLERSLKLLDRICDPTYPPPVLCAPDGCRPLHLDLQSAPESGHYQPTPSVPVH